MAASDALIVGEDCISEHYFTTDAKSESFQAKVARTAQGLGRGRARRDGARPTVRSRFIAARSQLGPRLADLLAGQPRTPTTTSCPTCTPDLRQILGYDERRVRC